MKKDADRLVSEYREALKELYGDEVAEKSKVYYAKGWYYIRVARTYSDGSVGTIGLVNAYRAKTVVEMIEVLKRRKSLTRA
jgi:hypothetical protein